MGEHYRLLPCTYLDSAVLRRKSLQLFNFTLQWKLPCIQPIEQISLLLRPQHNSTLYSYLHKAFQRSCCEARLYQLWHTLLALQRLTVRACRQRKNNPYHLCSLILHPRYTINARNNSAPTNLLFQITTPSIRLEECRTLWGEPQRTKLF